ncbi:hypothetical protein [Butyrivibrio fibrisolvens]|uniref:hypothetical protein n=1 Tax=Butyrivibrio fibrisolvens TaxID=831 RepID=UPI0020BFB5F3|nr:hypothetical protein [Butyrivibrio fibrisolvens]
MKHSNLKTKCSYVVMGLGQFLYGQRIKGILYMGILAIYLIYLFTQGISDMTGLFTLGTIEGDPWLGTKGDDSIIMMLKGILSFMILGAVIIFYLCNIRDIKNIQKLAESGRRAPGFLKSVESFVDKKFYVVALFAPVVGVLIFNVLPIVFMILIAFTNYGGNIVPPKLIDWVGFDNFKQIFAMSGIKETFLGFLAGI